MRRSKMPVRRVGMEGYLGRNASWEGSWRRRLGGDGPLPLSMWTSGRIVRRLHPPRRTLVIVVRSTTRPGQLDLIWISGKRTTRFPLAGLGRDEAVHPRREEPWP